MGCEIFYVDMEGQHDGRAIKTIVPQLNPRQVVSLSEFYHDLGTPDLGNLARIIYPVDSDTVT